MNLQKFAYLSPRSVFFGAHPYDSLFSLTNKAHCFWNQSNPYPIFHQKAAAGAVLPDFTHTTNENVRNQFLGGNDPLDTVLLRSRKGSGLSVLMAAINIL